MSAESDDDEETSGEFESISSSDEKSSSSPLARNISVLRRSGSLSPVGQPLRRVASSPHSIVRSAESSEPGRKQQRVTEALVHRMNRLAIRRGSVSALLIRSASGPEPPATFTLIAYSPDCLGLSPKRLFCVPNSQIDGYMRACMVAAHQCAKPSDHFTQPPKTPQMAAEEAAAKFVVIYVLDPTVPLRGREHRTRLIQHSLQTSPLKRGAWAHYEIAPDTTDFADTPVTHNYLFHLFV